MNEDRASIKIFKGPQVSMLPATMKMNVQCNRPHSAHILPRSTQAERLYRPITHRCRHRAVSRRPSVITKAQTKIQGKQMTFDTKDAQASLRFGEIFEDGVTKIVVADVAPNSPAEEAGIKVGQQVTAVSDPNFPNQLLDTSRQASKIGVTRSLSLRISPTIDMAFGDVPKTLKSIGSEDAIRDKLMKDNRESSSKVNISEERKQDRAQLISEQGTRSGKNVLGFAGVSAIFLFGLPLVILAIAIGSGYLQQLGGNYGF